MDPEKDGQVGGQPADAGTKVNPEGQPGQGQEPKVSQLPDDALVELPGGEKVTYGELTKGYMKDGDYRKKTEATKRKEEEIERREADLEREKREAMYGRPGEGYGEGEQPTPEEIQAARLNRVEAISASLYLQGQVDRLSSKYPDADKEAVFDRCWSNPEAKIEDEMKRDQERVAGVRESVSFEDMLKDPEKKKEYDQKVIENYNATRTQKKDAAGGFATGSGKAPEEGDKPAESFEEAGEKLRKNLEEQDKVLD